MLFSTDNKYCICNILLINVSSIRNRCLPDKEVVQSSEETDGLIAYCVHILY